MSLGKVTAKNVPRPKRSTPAVVAKDESRFVQTHAKISAPKMMLMSNEMMAPILMSFILVTSIIYFVSLSVIILTLQPRVGKRHKLLRLVQKVQTKL